ncbi:MAG: type IX secretion system outer membrane channel protein PorV [Rhodothermales bacterium]|nr:type IX secretion system outer membrane channel protein PorV [Rhodothermales bacterium]
MRTNPLRSLRHAALALAVLIGLGAGAQAQVVYTTAVPFLQIEPDSRAAGMGNAGVALADNASAIFWNPAGLASQRGAELSLTHAQWLPQLTSDLFYEYLVGKYHVDGIGTFGGHLTFLNLGEQEYRGPNNEDLGTFRSYELAVGGSYARNVTEKLALGGGARFIYSNLSGGVEIPGTGGAGTETKAGVSVGLDLGALYTVGTFDAGGVALTPKLAFNLANMGPKIGYTVGDCNEDTGESCGDPIPTNLRFGGALGAQLDEFNRLNFALDFNKVLVDYEEFTFEEVDQTTGEKVTRTGQRAKPFAEALFSSWGPVEVCSLDDEEDGSCEDVGLLRQITIGTGLEYWYNDLFAFRTGYFYEDPYNGNRQFLTFGAGIRYNLIGVDFSYIYPLEENSPLANTIRFSLLLNVLR